jgi:hypothetical protein
MEKREDVSSSNIEVTCIHSVSSSIKGESLSADVRVKNKQESE